MSPLPPPPTYPMCHLVEPLSSKYLEYFKYINKSNHSFHKKGQKYQLCYPYPSVKEIGQKHQIKLYTHPVIETIILNYVPGFNSKSDKMNVQPMQATQSADMRWCTSFDSFTSYRCNPSSLGLLPWILIPLPADWFNVTWLAAVYVVNRNHPINHIPHTITVCPQLGKVQI